MKGSFGKGKHKRYFLSTMVLVMGVFFVSLFHIPATVDTSYDNQEQSSGQEILTVAPATIVVIQSTLDVQLFVIETISMLVQESERFPRTVSEVVKQGSLGRVLFRLIISPNAP